MADPFGAIASAGMFGGGLFGSSSDPYKKSRKYLEQYADKAASYQNPFYDAGTAAIPQYQDWLSGMKDPASFINNLTNQYQESPYQQYEQDQAMRAAKNMGSSSGLTGSTPLMLQAQENSANISNKYMEDWLRNVLGINTQYGMGLNNMVGMGQNSANNLSQIYSNLGNQLSGSSAASSMANSQNMGAMLSGLLGLAMFL